MWPQRDDTSPSPNRRRRPGLCAAGLCALLAAAVGVGQAQVSPPAPPPASAATGLEGVESFVLPSGLSVVVVYRPEDPNFTATFLHKAGVAREWQGLYGAAHLLGRLLDDGTARVGSVKWRSEVKLLVELDRLDGEIERTREQAQRATPEVAQGLSAQLQRLSERFEASQAAHRALVLPHLWASAYEEAGGEGPTVQVGHDGITYTVTAPVRTFPWFVAMESQRMTGLVTRSFYDEREALAREWAQEWQEGGGGPLLEELMRLGLPASPYGHYRGNPDQVRSINRAEMQFFLKTFTSPANSTLVLVGGVDAGAARRLLARAKMKSTTPAGELENPTLSREGKRHSRLTTTHPAELLYGWPTPTTLEGRAGVAVLRELLAHPTAGLLPRLATPSAAAWLPAQGLVGPREPGLLVVGLRAAEPCGLHETLRRALALLATQGPPEPALVAARSQVSARVAQVVGQSHLLAPQLAWTLAATGDIGALGAFAEAVGRVDGAQIRRLALELFDPARGASVWGLPDTMKGEPTCAP